MHVGGDGFDQLPTGAGRRGVDTTHTKLYETLGVHKKSSHAEIKKAYRKLAVKHHPDKGGDEHKFKEINAAYEILSDEDKRSRYDRFGLDGMDDNNSRTSDIFDLFFGGKRFQKGPRRSDDVNHALKVSLEDLYNGKTVKLAVQREVIKGSPAMCHQCEGRGKVLELRQIGLGMVQQIQRPCGACRGQGYLCETDRQKKVLEIHVERGMKNKQKISFRGMADEKPNMEPGDVHFVIHEKEHRVFKRKGADLLITKTLTLKEALTGFAWKIKHLDGRKLVVSSRPGEVIRANSGGGKPFVKMIPNEGMPCRGNPFVRGNLYVLFNVQFPEENELSGEAIDALRKFLPGPSPTDLEIDHEDEEVVHLDATHVGEFGKGGLPQNNNDSAYDSDSDEGPRAVNCQQS